MDKHITISLLIISSTWNFGIVYFSFLLRLWKNGSVRHLIVTQLIMICVIFHTPMRIITHLYFTLNINNYLKS